MLHRSGLAAALLLVLSSTALAASGPYVGVHGGRSGVDVSLGSGELRLESTDFAWKGFLGVGLGRFLAVETGYVSFGTSQDSVAGTNLEQDLWGWDTAALLKVNIGPIDIYGRVGGVYWKSKVGIGNVSLTDDGFGVNYGGGLGVVLGKVEIRGEYVYYEASDIGEPWMASLGLTIGF
jgi:hypothetical protein